MFQAVLPVARTCAGAGGWLGGQQRLRPESIPVDPEGGGKGLIIKPVCWARSGDI